MRRFECIALASLLSLAGVRASAQQPSDVATAQALFDDGKAAMQAGNYAAACPKLVESQRLDPGGGTLLAIALCHEKQGRLATAWGDFNVALDQARKDGRAERVKAAQEHIDALATKIARVRVVVTQPAPAGLEVRRDGELVGTAQLGTPLPIDSGQHTFEARAPGKTTWTSSVPVSDGAGVIDVTVPALENAKATPIATSTPTPTPTPTPTSTSTPTPTPTETSHSDLRTWGFVTGAVGLVGIGVGTIFGLSASSKWSNAQAACPNDVCKNPNDATLGTQAGTAADFSTAFFLIGGAALVAGGVMVFLAPSDAPAPSSAHIRIEPMLGRTNGIAIGGTL